MSFVLTKLGSLLAGGGVIWAVYIAANKTHVGANAAPVAAGNVIAHIGPLETCAAGVLMWLIGKWMRHTSVHM